VAQHQPGHGTGELAGELGAAAPSEQVDDRQVIAAAACRQERLRSAVNDLDPIALPAEHQRQGLGVAGIVLDEQDGSAGSHGI
jgi:hypothetical protein